MTQKTTAELTSGDVVLVGFGKCRRVGSIADSGYVNTADETISNVYYMGPEDASWSGGNSAVARTVWTLGCRACWHPEDSHVWSHPQGTYTCGECRSFCDLDVPEGDE